MKTVAVLLAAGRSERFGEDKLTLATAGGTVWLRSYRALATHPLVSAVGIVASDALVPQCRAEAADALFVVQGGASRTESARIGFRNVPEEYDCVLFHDAARPFLSERTVSNVIKGVVEHGAAFPAVPVTDTVKMCDGGRYSTLDRSRLLAVQTPQGALRGHFQTAFDATAGDATDDMALLEAAGISAVAVEGDPENVKITARNDLPATTEARTGIGYDIHRFAEAPERQLWLGGVLFEDEGPGLEGHSDADVVLHAVVDALLGAAGLGDIGERFPDTDPQWKDSPSAAFLKDSARLVQKAGWEIVNIDVSVLAERPRIMPRRDEIRRTIAELAGFDTSRVNVKATTNEGLGAIGREEGVAAFAVATLRRSV